MSNYFEQIPFSGAEFAENPEPRVPVVLLLDTSGSMHGQRIDQLNAGFAQFIQEIQSDPIAAKRVELEVISFGPIVVESTFTTIDSYKPLGFMASGDTPMGAAIEKAIGDLTERKTIYRTNGIAFYRPWIFVITDGSPTDSYHNASLLIKNGEDSKSFMFFAVGVVDADINKLRTISVREPLMLKGLQFKEFFLWLSNSLSQVSRSQPTDIIPMPSPSGWAVIG